jgi:hypothetical protein
MLPLGISREDHDRFIAECIELRDYLRGERLIILEKTIKEKERTIKEKEHEIEELKRALDAKVTPPPPTAVVVDVKEEEEEQQVQHETVRDQNNGWGLVKFLIVICWWLIINSMSLDPQLINIITFYLFFCLYCL